MTTPQISPYTGEVPDRATNSSQEFSDNADDMVSYIAVIPDEYNELATFVNGAASAAQGAGNYQGEWSTLTGAYSAGISVGNSGETWLLLVALADITLSEPTDVNSDWMKLASFDTISRITVQNRLDGDQNFNVYGGTNPIPDATPRNYLIGEKLSATVEVITEDATNLTKVGGVVTSADNAGVLRKRYPLNGSPFITKSSEYAGVQLPNGEQVQAVVDDILTTGVRITEDSGDLCIDAALSHANLSGGFKFFGSSGEVGIWEDVSDDHSIYSIYNYLLSKRTLMDVTSSRSFGVVRTNNNPVKIEVHITTDYDSTSSALICTVDNVRVEQPRSAPGGTLHTNSASFTVESGETYAASCSKALGLWTERALYHS